MEPKIDNEFKELLPLLSEQEYEALSDSVVKDGVRDPLIVWKEKGILLDGHNRLEICDGIGIEPPIKKLSFKTRELAYNWIITNQLGRRNLHPNHYAYYLGKRYEAEKKSPTQAGAMKGKSSGQNVQTSKSISGETNKDEKTIRRNAEFSKGVDTLEKEIPGSKAKILNGRTTLTKGEIQRVSKVGKAIRENPKVKEEVARRVEGKPKSEEESDLDKMLRANEKKPYPWRDISGLNAVLDGVESLRKVPISRIQEYLEKSPMGRDIAQNSSIQDAANFLNSLCKKLK